MKITIFRDYKEENWHSMEVYTDNLVKHLGLLYKNQLTIRQHTTLPGISRFFPAHHKQIRHIFRYIVNPIGAISRKADIFHITDHANAHLLAVLNKKRTVVTCHDLTAPYWMMTYVKPSLKKRIKHAVERWRLQFMHQAAHIIAVSEATKSDIINTLHIPAQHITVIPEGIDPLFRPVKGTDRIKDVIRRHHLPRKYVLHVGTNYYNKNVEGLLSLFFSLTRRDPDLYLVKAGEKWTHHQEQIIRQSPFASRVIHIGFVATHDLPVLYSLAQILLQPSYAEGFGLTVLEAMACGCPVVVSNIPALTEVAGKDAVSIHTKPTSEDIQKIILLLTNKKKAATHACIGLDRSKQYSWETCAQRTFRIYQNIYAGDQQ